MIFGGFVVDNFAIFITGGATLTLLRLVNQWYREDVSATGLKYPSNFPKSFVWIKHVFHYILSDKQIEIIIRESQAFKALGTVAILRVNAARFDVGEILRCRIRLAFIKQLNACPATTRGRFVN